MSALTVPVSINFTREQIGIIKNFEQHLIQISKILGNNFSFKGFRQCTAEEEKLIEGILEYQFREYTIDLIDIADMLTGTHVQASVEVILARNDIEHWINILISLLEEAKRNTKYQTKMIEENIQYLKQTFPTEES